MARMTVACSLTVLCLTRFMAATAAGAPADVEVDGAWSTPFDLQVQGIHTMLLPTGRVLLFQRPKLSFGSDARVWDPATGSLHDVSFLSARDLFCAGHSLLPDGRILVTGGHMHGHAAPLGARETDIFDPVTETWSAAPPLSVGRWYPSNVKLGNGTTLIFGGWEDVDAPVSTVEAFDPVTGLFLQLPETATQDVGLYPRTLLLGSGEVFMAGPDRTTQAFDPTTNTWTVVGDMSMARRAGNAVLLPGLTKVLAFGGKGGATTDTAEIIDFTDPTPQWRSTGSMTHARKHASGVLLPDGTVLVVGGGRTANYDDPQKQAEVFDPDTETWTPVASQVASRMYHSSAVLLPDGRVLSLGQDKKTSHGKTGEIYSPPYLFRGPRPTIGTAPAAVGYGGTFIVTSADAARVTRMALVAPGSSTHSVDFSQRYVDVPFTLSKGKLNAVAPLDGNTAPPGWYMLFLVNADGVPSVASWVHVGPGTEGFDSAPRATPTTNERSAPASPHDRGAGPAPAYVSTPPNGPGLVPELEWAVWTDPVLPDGSGALFLRNPEAPHFQTLLLLCRSG